jgi:hypothetical protein
MIFFRLKILKTLTYFCLSFSPSEQSATLLDDKIGDRDIFAEKSLPQPPFFRAANRSKSFRTPRQRFGSGSVRQSLASFSSGAGSFKL